MRLGDQSRDLRGRHVRDVGRALVDRVDLAPIEIDAGRDEARARELDRERQPDVAEADDADARRVRSVRRSAADETEWLTTNPPAPARACRAACS